MHFAFLNISIEKAIKIPVFVQIGNQIICLLKEGKVAACEQLPSTRELSIFLKVHRKTVIRAYDELIAQGWLESYTGSGTFAARHLPEVSPQVLVNKLVINKDPIKKAGFSFETFSHLDLSYTKVSTRYHLDDGFPDVRLAPLAELSRAYRSKILLGNRYTKLGYTDPKGSDWLRDLLAKYFKETRGLHVSNENILITRGSVMGVYTASTGLLKKGDLVITGEKSWSTADANFIQAGAELLRVPVDEHGIKVDELEKICRQKKIRLVYVTPHHHYPTTVALRADRRIQLIKLAEKYGFIIFEDDYDYDFHYQNKPLMPLVSADTSGMVIYCGSFTKVISPAFRIGYLVGSADVINHLAQLRRIIDRQGDNMLENSIAELLQEGIIQRHLRKSLRVYRQRRDLFCSLLKDQLGNFVQFEIPDGGMAVWTKFDAKIDLVDLAERALRHDLFFSNGLSHLDILVSQTKTLDYISAASTSEGTYTRLGFASSTAAELTESIEILTKLLKS